MTLPTLLAPQTIDVRRLFEISPSVTHGFKAKFLSFPTTYFTLQLVENVGLQNESSYPYQILR